MQLLELKEHSVNSHQSMGCQPSSKAGGQHGDLNWEQLNWASGLRTVCN